MKTEMINWTGHGDTALSAVFWIPDGKVTAVLQVTHGMTEHMGRYEALAEYLTGRGIAVAGFDLRGHGKNPGNHKIASLGKGGWEDSIADMRMFFDELEHRFPNTPHYMLGFSLGSFLLREYLGRYSDNVAGAIIMGTGQEPRWILSVMMGVVKGQIKKAGFDKTTDLVRKLSFGTYNQKFKPNRTDADWLSANSKEVKKYRKDPLVRRDISAGLFYDMLASMKRTGGATEYKRWNRDLPVLLISGKEDPVGKGGKGVEVINLRMTQSGMQNVTALLIPGARHDLLHEEVACTEAVRTGIADWIG